MEVGAAAAMEADPERQSKKQRRRRDFNGATALDIMRHFYVPWKQFDEMMTLLLERRNWLLITGPFQSGKSSLAFALADAAAEQGWISFVTTLTSDMVDVANDSTASDVEASNRFFSYLAAAVEMDSGGVLKCGSIEAGGGGMMQITGMFRFPLLGIDRRDEPDTIWFLDEAGLLNDITRPCILKALLGGLRNCKQQSRSGSTSRLRNFSLVGTGRLERLLSSARSERVEEARIQGVPYVPRQHDPFNPFPPSLGSFSPLSLETPEICQAALEEADILKMLQEYGREHGVCFRIHADGPMSENEVALQKFASSIYGVTDGYKGLVGSCCEYIQNNGIRSLAKWKQELRDGSIFNHCCRLTVYSRIVSQIPLYAQQLKTIILECISAPISGFPYTHQMRSVLLPALNDGLLAVDSNQRVSISSPMLLAAILQDCKLRLADELPVVETFEASLHASFRYMQPTRLLKADVVNRNGQPSEYIWQSEFLLALKFMLDNCYSRRMISPYAILVECKKRNKRGQRRVRVDFVAKNSRLELFEVQGKGTPATIQQHMLRSEKYRKLFAGCEMNYIYFVVGEDAVAKDVIQKESAKYASVKCWFVQYLEELKVWNVEQLQQSGWQSVKMDLPSSYPQFNFATREY